VWWLVLAPNIRRYRAETGSNSGEHFEWLAGAMAEIDRKAGQPVVTIDSFVGNLDRRIQKFQEQVAIFEDLRAVVTKRRDADVPALAVTGATDRVMTPPASPEATSPR